MQYETLLADKINRFDNFGHSIVRPGYHFLPTNADQVKEVFDLANKNGCKIALRGAGRSYGDAALNSGGIVIDFQIMNKILDWNPETGVITLQPGVTIEQVWRHTLRDGWWLPVSPGTMLPTIGGCLGANVHGKNNWQTGTFGEHVLSFDAVLPSGKRVTCTPKSNAKLFRAIIGGMGLLGVFTSVTMQLKKVYSGNVLVTAWAEPNIGRILAALDEGKENDYIVAWVDTTAGGRKLGRGQMHSANYLAEGEDLQAENSLNPDFQDLPGTIFGVVPKSIVHKVMRLGMNNLGAWGVNTAKYFASRALSNHKTYPQSLVAFTYLLDYVPHWELAYGRGGLIQYQSFLPKETAEAAFGEILKRCQRHRLPSYLGVAKRHRPDDFLLSHALDGFSLALDFKVTDGSRQRLIKLTGELNQIVLSGGGRFYFAKDSTLTAEAVRAYLGGETVDAFLKLKQEVDPHGILQSDLFKRCFGE